MRLKVSIMAPAVVMLGVSAVYTGRAWIERQVANRTAAFEKAAIDRNAARRVEPQSTIVVVSQPLAFGTELTRSALREVPWPKDAAIAGSFKTIDEVFEGAGRRAALAALQVNEPLLARKITGNGQRANLAAVIAPNHKAMTVHVDEFVGVAGLLMPGDHVDVLLTRKIGEGDATSSLVSQDIKVLGVDQSVDETNSKASIARSVTLEVSTQAAQRLAVAQMLGSLTLVLRPTVGDVTTTSQPVSALDVISGARAKDEPHVTVGVIRNNSRQDYNVPAAAQ
ncbi:MAG: Flp pilus assembly protein CpaB [Hyphomicrobiales bacterium]|nr:Flp pilus assembly protein CpaB [Hyphomicrobiales bacterium]